MEYSINKYTTNLIPGELLLSTGVCVKMN